eukprot:TRINITY_DN24667_c0_g1_i1.p1 TRINITY_DN24667_c0_g1~~TRINITY_DN24667_c0_g1_i1.p1  ORF type:complete len:805 (+),score=133.27 TRINITY_DN24667_c0_g1_i1:158-2572(+)
MYVPTHNAWRDTGIGFNFDVKDEDDSDESSEGGEHVATGPQEDAPLPRSRSNLERVQAFAGPQGLYHNKAAQVMVALDPESVDREALKRVIVDQQQRLLGCLSLPFSLAFFLVFSALSFLHEDITNVYIIESGIRKYLNPGLDEVETIPDVWKWLNTSLVPKLFNQIDSSGQRLSDKSDWSYVLMYNQLQGPMVLSQLRSERLPCNSVEGRLDDMECFPLTKPSTETFGQAIDVAIAQPENMEYATDYNVTLEERKAYFDRSFQVNYVANSPFRRLRVIDTKGYDQYDVGGGPFDAFVYPNTPTPLIQEHLNYLYAKRWLDSQSTQLSVKALLLNEEVGRPRIEQVQIAFYFSRGGDILSRLTLESVFLEFWSGYMSQMLDFLWLVMLIFLTVLELRDGRSAWKRREMKKKFSGFRTLLECMIILLGWSIVFGNIFQEMLRLGVMHAFEEVNVAQRQDMAAETNMFGNELHAQIENIIFFQGYLRWVVAEYHLVLLFRFFTGFSAQPRLGIAVGTLESSIVDIIHFFIVLLPTFLAYVIAGCFIFGRRMEDFSTFSRAVGVCFKMLMEGEYDWPELSREDWWTSLIWSWSFLLLLVLLMLNMVLAIILDIYTDLRRRTGRAETVWETLLNLWHRVYYRKQWISNAKLTDNIDRMPRRISRQELLSQFPSMCDAQLKMIIAACDKESEQVGNADTHDSVRITMGAKLCVSAVDAELQELQKELLQFEDPVERPFQPPTKDRGWQQEISERMAVNNHHMLSLQWQLQQLQWQLSTVESLNGALAETDAPAEQGEPSVFPWMEETIL